MNFYGWVVCSGTLTVISALVTDFEFVKVTVEPNELLRNGINVHVETATKHFDLSLEANRDIFTDDFVIDDGLFHYDERDVVHYKGKIAGLARSKVLASIANKRFEGILFQNGTGDSFHIEDGRFLSEIDCSKDPFHDTSFHNQYCTILFRDRDDKRVKREANENHIHDPGMCGWNDPNIAASLEQWLPKSAMLTDEDTAKIRDRRAPHTAPKVCSLYMQIDTTLWSLYMSDFNNNERLARTALTQLVGDLVASVSEIYSQEEFYTDDGTIEKMSGFTFQVNRIRIYKKEQVCNSNDGVLKQLCNDYIDSDAFLKINSQMNHDHSCLAYILSHRVFSGGVMGLAWLGYPSGYVGGVCQRQTSVSFGAKSSYNTGIVTSNNQGSRVSKRSLMLTLAHEIGHNFGSPHDQSDECTPRGSSGYYIMYPYVNPGNKPNNDEFSDCSRNSMALNLNAILQGRKHNCFTETLAPFCGNMVPEKDEECDCGMNAEECAQNGDTCCGPADSGANACKILRNRGFTCSPSQGPCCNPQTCQHVPKSQNLVCAIAGECMDEAVCNGLSPQCPKGSAKPDRTRCALKTRLCISGECSASICEEINYESCQEEMVKGSNAADYCYLSCREKGLDKPCLSSRNPSGDANMTKLMQGLNGGEPLILPAGSPCDQYRGVCDPFRRCRLVNTQGPLAKLYTVLTGKAEIETVSDWLVHYWWVVAICAVVFIAISFCLLKYCSDLLPTSNPKFQGSISAYESFQHFGDHFLLRRRNFRRFRSPQNQPPF